MTASPREGRYHLVYGQRRLLEGHAGSKFVLSNSLDPVGPRLLVSNDTARDVPSGGQ